MPAYQEIAELVKGLYDVEKQSTTQIMKTFKIGSRITFYKILLLRVCTSKDLQRKDVGKSLIQLRKVKLLIMSTLQII